MTKCRAREVSSSQQELRH